MKTEEIEKILDEYLIGVNKNKLNSHHDFKPSVIKAMREYHKQEMEEMIPSDEEIKIEAQKYWQHSTDLLSIWFEKGAKWFKSLFTQEEQ